MDVHSTTTPGAHPGAGYAGRVWNNQPLPQARTPRAQRAWSYPDFWLGKAGQRESLIAFAILTALSFATRAWLFGNPVIGIDEQFYSLVGDRMLNGSLPYVDIFDRKPIGLFLIYAFARAVFGHAVVGYQLLSALSVTLTAWLLYTIARRLTSFSAAFAAAAAYPVWLLVFAGVSGQSPTYYNLPMVAAASMLLALVAGRTKFGLTAHGSAIMLLVGLAMQIKYTAVFEGIFFGLTLLWAGWRQGWSLAKLTRNAAMWVGCALLPTLVAWAVYTALGHGDAFIQANFASIFGDENSSLNALARLAGLLIGISPFGACLWIAVKHRRPANAEIGWIFAWTGASFAGFLVFGVYYDHYVQPLLLPLCLIAALAFDKLPRRRMAMAGLFTLGLIGGFGRAIVDVRQNGNAREAAQLAALVQPHLGSGCLYVNEDLPVLYLLTHSCIVTRFAFPEHLVLYRYEHAIGVDQLGELRRIMRERPAVVVKSTMPDDDTRVAARLLLEAGLRKDYRLVGQASVGDTRFEVYARDDPYATAT